MISHEHRIIGIHIPRTGMTSMEKALCGNDWWKIDPDTKHLRASDTRAIYGEYWESYFKFSFVRNPFDRVVSMLKFKDRVPHDGSFPDFVRALLAEQGLSYGAWLDEKMDFVGRFETLQADWTALALRFGIDPALPHSGRTPQRRDYRDYFDAESRALVEQVHGDDLIRFGYEF